VPAGTPIVTITVIRDDIFDNTLPATSSWPYRWANHLHVTTRERYIRSLLLFKVGDPLDPEVIAESERLLRSTGYLTPVTITVREAPGGAEVVVHTHDQWTTLAGVSFGVAGNRNHFGFSVTERNALGWGKLVDLEYDKSTERTITTLGYKDKLFLGTRWQLELEYANASDGKIRGVNVQYPFFALSTPKAGGASWLSQTQTDYLYVSGEKAISGTSRTDSFRLWGGLRVPGDGAATDRLTFGVFGDKAEFSDWKYTNGLPYETPAGHDMQGLLVGWDHQTDHWKVVEGFRTWHRQEDVPLGPNWTVTAGVSLPAFGGDRARVQLDGVAGAALMLGREYLWVNMGTSGRIESGGFANEVAHLDVGTAFTGPTGWRGRLAMDFGHNLDGNVQLALGADTGLRGWDPDSFDGTSRAILNLEWRHVLTGEVLHLGYIGGVVFVDAGKTWAPRIGPGTDGIRKDAGLGLLVESTRASQVAVIRLELAYPDRGKGPVFLISSQSLF
jgi:hypothetical protein